MYPPFLRLLSAAPPLCFNFPTDTVSTATHRLSGACATSAGHDERGKGGAAGWGKNDRVLLQHTGARS